MSVTFLQDKDRGHLIATIAPLPTPADNTWSGSYDVARLAFSKMATAINVKIKHLVLSLSSLILNNLLANFHILKLRSSSCVTFSLLRSKQVQVKLNRGPSLPSSYSLVTFTAIQWLTFPGFVVTSH